MLVFHDAVTDSAKAAFFGREGMSVLGVRKDLGAFFVRIPDPGPIADSLYAATRRLRTLPEIRNAAPIEAANPIRGTSGRYPDDGADMKRANWLAPGGQSTWAMQAIRAPLAWGCETGAYEGAGVNVGVLEYEQVHNHPDYAGSVRSVWSPPLSNRILLGGPATQAKIDSLKEHATAVTGMLTASGNNAGGVAGVMWRTQLHLFQLHAADGRALNLITGFRELGMEVIKRDLRILSVSSGPKYLIGPDTGTQRAHVALLVPQLKWLLDTLPGLTIVHSAGNDRLDVWPTDYGISPGASMLLSALLELRVLPAYESRIIIVAGTSPSNTFWLPTTGDGSNFIRLVTDIAAPANTVRALTRWQSQTLANVPVGYVSGNSFATPMVAGVAAQLLTMKPSLTPKDVKDYIRDGARVSRQDPATGVESARAPVNGAPGELYELDAYGSLRKLSREHAGTPVCGVEVVGGNSDKIEIRRATTETIDLGSAYYAYAGQLVSVAQGGRRFATMIPHRYVDAAGTWTFRLQQGQWSVDTVEGPSMILYTEQDTAYVSQSWRPAADTTLSPSQLDLHVRIGSEQPGRRVAQTTVTSFLPLSSGSGWLSWGAGVVSPTGDWVVFDFYKYETDNCTGTVGDQYINSIYAVPMRGSTTPQTVSSTSWQTNCQGGDYPDGWDDGGIAAAWRDDGTEFLTARRIKHATSWEVDLRRVGVGTSSVTPSSFPTHTGAEQAYTLKWAPEGGRVRFGYAQGGTWNCMTEVRQASALGTLIGSPEPCVPTSPSAQAPSQLLASLQILKPRFNNGFYHWTDPLVRRARMAQLAARRQQALRPISNR